MRTSLATHVRCSDRAVAHGMARADDTDDVLSLVLRPNEHLVEMRADIVLGMAVGVRIVRMKWHDSLSGLHNKCCDPARMERRETDGAVVV